MLERLFQVRERGSTIPRELIGGTVTFMTMAYIISVQPLMMSIYAPEWMSFGDPTFLSLMVGTCLIAGIASFAMAFLANYPVALAPGMGINVMFATMIGVAGVPPQAALGLIFFSGVIFFILTFFRLREFILGLIRPAQQAGIVVGIGLFILMLGLLNMFERVGSFDLLAWRFDLPFNGTVFIVFLINLAIVGILMLFRIPGGLFIGMASGAVVASLFGLINVDAVMAPIPSMEPTFFNIDFVGALQFGLLPFLAIFLYVDMFETMATLIGVTRKAGLVDKDGNIFRAGKALMADAVGTLGGSLLGVSPVTSYIESSAGIVTGARTGLASIATGLLFLGAVFFTPLWLNLASNVIVGPVLVLVGLMMVGEVRKVNWGDWSDWLPATLTAVVMVALMSIAEGLAVGFIFYPICKFLAGQGRSLNWLHWAMAILSVVMLGTLHTTF